MTYSANIFSSVTRRRIFLASVLAIAVALPTTAQLITDIQHEPFRDNVLVTYMLNGLAPHQRVSVNLYCSDDDYKDAVKNVSGNGAGEYVTGNGQKTILWNVLSDRKELVGNISFEIRALVFSDNASAAKTASVSPASPVTVEEKKSMLYAEMSSSLGNFIIRAKDLVIAFRDVNEQIFEDNLNLRKMTDAIIQYNNAFNTLNSGRMGYEKQVLLHWNNEVLYSDLRNLFDYALGELHSVNVLELNGSLAMINDINLGKISGRKNEREAREKVLSSVILNTGQLDKRIQELERRASRILYTLSNR
jgi:hypothetical protein